YHFSFSSSCRLSSSLYPTFSSVIPPPPTSPLFPYTTLFRSIRIAQNPDQGFAADLITVENPGYVMENQILHQDIPVGMVGNPHRSEEHTSELQSRFDLVCRLLLEK